MISITGLNMHGGFCQNKYNCISIGNWLFANSLEGRSLKTTVITQQNNDKHTVTGFDLVKNNLDIYRTTKMMMTFMILDDSCSHINQS